MNLNPPKCDSMHPALLFKAINNIRCSEIRWQQYYDSKDVSTGCHNLPQTIQYIAQRSHQQKSRTEG